MKTKHFDMAILNNLDIKTFLIKQKPQVHVLRRRTYNQQTKTPKNHLLNDIRYIFPK